MTYEDECKLGRQYATQVIADTRATGDLPKFVRTVRDMAGAEDGVAVGFMFEMGKRLIDENSIWL